ncbi:MAG: helix-turn-helix domain-containing protein [Chitinophagales bacterium]|nr:helix-turn-helix domain-containing protein [Chitinophagales bacterium]
MKKIPTRKITATTKEPAIAAAFSIRKLSDLLDGKDMLQELHRHDFFYLLALEKGAGVHEIDFTSFTVCNHSLFFMRPGQVHQLTLKAGSTGYLVQFNADFYYPHDKAANQFLRKINTRSFFRFDTGSFKKPLSVLTHIFNEYSNRQEKYQEAIRADLDILLIELIRRHCKIGSTTTVSYTQEKLDEFLELVNTHLATHKQVSQYAAMMNLTPYQLNAISKTSLGKTCSQVITEHIILESKRYLLATTNQVNQIAWQLGYEDVSYFIRFFKKQTGYSPEQFRQNSR